MRLLLLASAGGAIGAGSRFLISQWFADRGLAGFPWATLTINVTGSMLMGLVVGLLAGRPDVAPDVRVFVATGVLGGYTTFSAFSLEFWQLTERGDLGAALMYVAGSVALSLAELGIGLALGRWIGT